MKRDVAWKERLFEIKMNKNANKVRWEICIERSKVMRKDYKLKDAKYNEEN